MVRRIILVPTMSISLQVRMDVLQMRKQRSCRYFVQSFIAGLGEMANRLANGPAVPIRRLVQSFNLLEEIYCFSVFQSDIPIEL